jgi:hypothetical protein
MSNKHKPEECVGCGLWDLCIKMNMTDRYNLHKLHIGKPEEMIGENKTRAEELLASEHMRQELNSTFEQKKSGDYND